ncbi:hypothetical protein BU14_0457s0017 [Porphyra umbilicalis]|uniref:Uncharacterized protein n=1 Tax=Porphyra umbilicalis TaxID=2786 RepID=A0A1X6NUC7_PORUM|nr:hypothetical protein BU14_0457s0017 [Porphyra umbilicalis]|eukprot:OSX72224.1 hypothetical protein BU14_0457s0017 [Porphyra umbilicalis]
MVLGVPGGGGGSPPSTASAPWRGGGGGGTPRRSRSLWPPEGWGGCPAAAPASVSRRRAGAPRTRCQRLPGSGCVGGGAPAGRVPCGRSCRRPLRGGGAVRGGNAGRGVAAAARSAARRGWLSVGRADTPTAPGGCGAPARMPVGMPAAPRARRTAPAAGGPCGAVVGRRSAGGAPAAGGCRAVPLRRTRRGTRPLDVFFFSSWSPTRVDHWAPCARAPTKHHASRARARRAGSRPARGLLPPRGGYCCASGARVLLGWWWRRRRRRRRRRRHRRGRHDGVAIGRRRQGATGPHRATRDAAAAAVAPAAAPTAAVATAAAAAQWAGRGVCASALVGWRRWRLFSARWWRRGAGAPTVDAVPAGRVILRDRWVGACARARLGPSHHPLFCTMRT